jgi:hypothetical protein
MTWLALMMTRCRPALGKLIGGLMQVSETLIDGDPERYEQRYSVRLGNTVMHMVRRPMAIEPEDGMVCFVDNGPRFGTIAKHTGAQFKGGKWRKVRFDVTHWTHWEHKADG